MANNIESVRKWGKRTAIGAVGGAALTLTAACFGGGDSKESSTTPTPVASATIEVTATSTPSEAAGTPTPEWVNPIKIESAQEAAQRFGADDWSQNPANWEINEYGGAHLKETEKAVKVNTAGAVLEGWVRANMIGARDALTIVADSNVPVVEVNGGTLWDFGVNSRAGFAQVLEQVRAREVIEQPDVTVVPLCADFSPINTTDVFVNRVESAQQAALMFGADEYSRNPNNWDINEWGGAHLMETNAASLVNLNGAVLEGWIRANREDGRNAITFVTYPNVLQMRTNGGTLWNFADSNRGFQQLLGQVIAREKVEQPDVTVLPAYNCVTK